jgi:hypothetical protein
VKRKAAALAHAAEIRKRQMQREEDRRGKALVDYIFKIVL